MKKTVRFNNILFPIWLFWLLPTYVWLIILPANFVIDSLVLVLAMNVLRLENKLSIWKHSILKVWIIGFVSDFIGAAAIFGIMLVLDSLIPRFNTMLFPGTTLISLPGVALAGVLIYFLNRRFSFTKCGLSAAQVHKLCLALAVFTAPHAMMIPLYG
ncbi:MAG: hypothetical protein J1E64_11320 [Acetatifactor sp.]|nr:hypothetical protein [Acetatifactor sp.]